MTKIEERNAPVFRPGPDGVNLNPTDAVARVVARERLWQ
jgi:hypothetical protein